MAHIRKSAILITGASGRLGSALLPLLLDRGATVVGCDRRRPQSLPFGHRPYRSALRRLPFGHRPYRSALRRLPFGHRPYRSALRRLPFGHRPYRSALRQPLAGKARITPSRILRGKNSAFIFEQCDLTSARLVESLFQNHRFDTVIHLAALLPKKGATADDLFRQNVMGTYQLISAAARAGVKRCIFSSSMTVYGLPQYLPVDEAHPREPLDLYGATKVMGEEVVKQLCAMAGTGYTILRFPGMFSPARHEGAVYHFVRRALQDEPIELTAEVPTPWDIILIDDAAAVIRDCVYASRSPSGAFNVGYGENVSLPIIARAIKRMTRSSSKIINRTSVIHPPFYFDTRKIKKAFGVRLPSLDVRLKEYITAMSKV